MTQKPKDEPPPEELQTAHQIHALAQLMYGRLGLAQRWDTAMPFSGYAALPGGHPAPWQHQQEEYPMFWHDPSLYGATLPPRDINFFGGVTPWQNFPRFAPQYYGFQPFAPQMGLNPYLQTQGFTPPQMPVNPYLQTQGLFPFQQMGMVNPYLYPPVFNRPFTY